MKTVRRSEFRVEVYPKSPGDFGFASIGGYTQSSKEWERDCDMIAEQIEQEISGLPSRGLKTAVVWDSEDVCSFCGRAWETMREEDGPDEDMPLGIPLCCDEAQDEWLASREEKSSTA